MMMKAKVFEVVLHKLPSGKSPATALEEQLNGFLGERPQLRLVATHMSTLVSPAEPNAMPRSEESLFTPIASHPALRIDSPQHRSSTMKYLSAADAIRSPSILHFTPEF